MGSIMAWNETRNNSHDDDDSTSHSLSLTFSLDNKTGGRPVADKSKTSPFVKNTTTAAFKSPSTYTDKNTDKITSIDKNTTTTFTYTTNGLPPSVEASCQKLYKKYGRPVKTYRKWKKSSSQPPIYTPDTTAGSFFWSGCDDPPESLAFYSAALQH